MGVLRRKIWADLWNHRGRTLRVVLIIAMGAFAIGMVIGTRNTIVMGMEEIWQRSSPAMIHLWAFPAVEDDTLTSLESVRGVAGVEGFAQATLEWRLSPDDEWAPGTLTARDDYENQQYARLSLISGDWPGRRTVAVGQGSDTAFSVYQGSQIQIRIDEREHIVDVGGVVYDPNVQPPGFGGNAQFYVTRERLEDLTGNDSFNRVLGVASRWDRGWVTEIADEMQDRLEEQGVESGGFAPPNGQRLTSPDKHFFQDVMDGVFFILGLMAVFALILGLLLVYNTIAATINRQIDQIGIMKAIGASAGRVFLVYLLNSFVYGALALVIALPLGALGARVLGAYLLDAFNAEGDYSLSPVAVIGQVVVALLSPLLASVIPISAGARMTVREAIRSYGLRANDSLLDRLVARLRFIPRVLSLTIGNTFRHKRRVLLTQVTLVLSGVIFMTVMGAREAAIYTFDELVPEILRFNVNFQLKGPERIDRVEALTLSYPGVESVEVWAMDDATIRHSGQQESNDDESVFLIGVPTSTSLYGPQMRAGRWLLPGDAHAVVLNQQLAENAGMSVGDTVTLKHGVKGESDWVVVGLLFDPVFTNSAHVPRDAMLKQIHSTNRASTVWIRTARQDAAGEADMARRLREYYRENRLELSAGGVFGNETAADVIGTVLGQFGIIVTLLATMAVVIGAVGSIALSGTLSLNVLDRRREIGVLKAIGAQSGVIARLFIGEGMLLGWLSWAIALPLSIPAGKLMVQGLSRALEMELVYRYTPVGAITWLVIMTVLSMIASWFPARSASRVTVREALAYE